MKVLIVEDEAPAVVHLCNLLGKQSDEIEVLENLDSVKSVVRWFESNDQPDLAFFDIQLADGKSFEIFEQTEVNCPIIFTTAYDNYALKAFEVNSIDYLLKPVSAENLSRALSKFKGNQHSPSIDLNSIKALMNQSTKKYKEQFLIRVGEHLKTILVPEVSYFFSEDRTTYLLTDEGQKFIVDFTLDQLLDMLDPSLFFRINRKHIVKMTSIKDMVAYSNSRLSLSMKVKGESDMIVSRDRVGEFKLWLDR